uniref:(northern house mosquito) hypothetical protein n=1 Tax=Culex pipiens TaxID=7175 RepID=A0A8D8G6J9_CULPI
MFARRTDLHHRGHAHRNATLSRAQTPRLSHHGRNAARAQQRSLATAASLFRTTLLDHSTKVREDAATFAGHDTGAIAAGVSPRARNREGWTTQSLHPVVPALECYPDRRAQGEGLQPERNDVHVLPGACQAILRRGQPIAGR